MSVTQVNWTTTIPNPRRDLNPSATVVLLSFTTPWNATRLGVFGSNEDWRRLIAVIVERDQRLWNAIPHTVEV